MKLEDILFYVIIGLIVIDNTIAIVIKARPSFSAFLRPLICGIFMVTIRESFFNLIKDLRDAGVVLAMMFVFIFVFANITYFFYAGTYGGFQFFPNLPEAFYQM